jgi:ATP synthase protein I
LEKETKEMLKKIIMFDMVIIMLTIIISMLIFKQYVFIIIFGVFMAVINFISNAIVTNYTLIKTGKRIFSILGAAARVIITFIIAVILTKNNKFNLIAFLGGYSLHYIAVIIYGMTLKNMKGSD